MRKTLFSLILILIAGFIYSQDFPAKSGIWYYSNLGGTTPTNSTLYTYEYEKDTVVNGLNARKLDNGMIFRSMNDSVLLYNHYRNRFELLYDYSAVPGDTIELGVPDGFTTLDTVWSIVINSIEYRVFGSDSIRVFHHGSLHPTVHFFDYEYADKYGTTYFLPLEGPLTLERDYLKCYVDSSIHINYSTIPCDSMITGVQNNIRNDGLFVFPNPTNHTLFIDVDLMKYDIFIYSSTGQLVLSEELNGSGQLDVSKFRTGLYFGKITSEGKSVSLFKFIKQ